LLMSLARLSYNAALPRRWQSAIRQSEAA